MVIWMHESVLLFMQKIWLNIFVQLFIQWHFVMS